MALNDYADRDVDAVERPGRPIPSGRVTPRFALGLAAGLTVAGGALATAADGPRALRVAAPLAASVWAYDVAIKRTPAGALGMSACRVLDVLLGSGSRPAAALPVAAVVGAHTAVTTALSRHEVQGAAPSTGRAALAATAAVSAAAGALAVRRRVSPLRVAAAAGLAGAYAAAVGGAQARVVLDPSPARLQQAVGAGVLGLMPLEGSLIAASGALAPAAGVAALWPVARRLARRRAVT
jgi:4-hydroxybenzoate polyprenyltransferase